MTLPLPAIMPDTPLCLRAAAREAFPDGTMTPVRLRRELQKHGLAIERIAGIDYTTLATIDQMRSLCRVQPKALASTYVNKPDARLFGSFATAPSSLALAALHQSVAALKASSPSTSAKNMSRRKTKGEARLTLISSTS